MAPSLPQAALAVALGLRTFLRLRHGGGERLCVRLPGVGVRREWDVAELRVLRDRITGGAVRHLPPRGWGRGTGAVSAAGAVGVPVCCRQCEQAAFGGPFHFQPLHVVQVWG